MARNGKIARLPREIRDELNHRLQDGEPGGSLLAWLNGLPVVAGLLARDFGGSPISKQNLCEWRAGGFAEWQARRDTLTQACELAADATELAAATDGKLTDHLAIVLAARYAALLAGWDGTVTEKFRRKLRVSHVLCQDIVELCRSGHSGARLKLEQDRLEREREKTVEEIVAHFERWAGNPAVYDLIHNNELNPAEKAVRIRQIFGLPPKSPRKANPVSSESNPVKPGQTNFSNGHPPTANPHDPAA
jgi:hypothetical protein